MEVALQFRMRRVTFWVSPTFHSTALRLLSLQYTGSVNPTLGMMGSLIGSFDARLILMQAVWRCCNVQEDDLAI